MKSEQVEQPPRLLPGWYAIVAIGVLAASLAGAAMWYHVQLQSRAHQFWGNHAAELILQADKVNAMRLVPVRPHAGTEKPGNSATESSDEEKWFTIDGRTWRVVEMKDVTKAPGFSHVRRSLMNDHGFDWTAPDPAGPIDWQYMLTFNAGPRSSMVLVCLDPARVQLAGGQESASIAPVAAGFSDFLAEQFPAAEQEPDSPAPGTDNRTDE